MWVTLGRYSSSATERFAEVLAADGVNNSVTWGGFAATSEIKTSCPPVDMVRFHKGHAVRDGCRFAYAQSSEQLVTTVQSASQNERLITKQYAFGTLWQLLGLRGTKVRSGRTAAGFLAVIQARQRAGREVAAHARQFAAKAKQASSAAQSSA